MEETQVKRSKQSELSDMLSKSLTYLLAETQLKFLFPLSKLLVQDKTQPELVVEVLLESKLLISLHSEESTKLFICWLVEPVKGPLKTTNLLLSVLLMKLSTARKATCKVVML